MSRTLHRAAVAVPAAAVLVLALAGCPAEGPSPHFAGEDTTAPADGAGDEGSVLPPPDAAPVPDGPRTPEVPACLSEGDCEDGDPCTTDICDPAAGCLHEPLPAGACDDGIACTTDSCETGAGCASTPDHGACDDGIACTTDTCEAGTGCVHTPDHGPCNDVDPCTDDACAPGSGCTHAWNRAGCNDGEPCTAGDTCLAGICRGTLLETNACAYQQVPSLKSCLAGKTSAAAKAEALATVNQVRALAGLPLVTYDPSGDLVTQAAALLMAANGALDHTPPETWRCWSEEGAWGASTSNLHLKWSTAPLDPPPPSEAIIGFLVDDGVPSLGHRRWLLDPFLPSVSWGAAGGLADQGGTWPYDWAGVLEIVKSPLADLSGLDPGFVACPVGAWPAAWFQADWYLSFAVLADTASPWGNETVSYEEAEIAVLGPGGSMNVWGLSWNNHGYGLPNHLQWRVAGLQEGVDYQVSITDVTVGFQLLSYEYWFRLE
ncbi:MAG: hypothetical protein FJ098_04095 [Deltaproteobacteria bacterium]|nr:hypothetical protein [Deltaproteobacteria bacterium]